MRQYTRHFALAPCFGSHPLGRPSSTSLVGPSVKLATLNQLVCLSPVSFFGPPLTPRAYLTISRPVDVGVSSGWSARRPMSCMRASECAGEVEKARAPLRARGTERAANMMVFMVVEQDAIKALKLPGKLEFVGDAT